MAMGDPVREASQVQEALIDGIDFDIRTELGQNFNHSVAHIGVQGVVATSKCAAVLVDQVPDLLGKQGATVGAPLIFFNLTGHKYQRLVVWFCLSPPPPLLKIPTLISWDFFFARSPCENGFFLLSAAAPCPSFSTPNPGISLSVISRSLERSRGRTQCLRGLAGSGCEK